MLDPVLRRFSEFDPAARIAELHRKLDRLESGLHNLEEETRAAGLAARGLDLSPFREMRTGLDAARAGLQTAAAHGDGLPGLRELLATADSQMDRLASRLEQIRARVRG